jgi:beta-lactamase class C
MKQGAKLRISTLLVSAILAACPSIGLSHDGTRQVVDAVIRPLMVKDGIPGMAVGVVVDGHPRVFDYGVASLHTHGPVTPDTLFEIGSASKTLTATLASYAVLTGHMALSDRVAKYFPSLRGTRFGDRVILLNLATHTPGGIPLQVPVDVRTRAELMSYLQAWRPKYPPGAYRTYSNIGIGLLGLAAAQSLHRNFAVLMQQYLLVSLGLRNTFVDVPATRMADYAQGYTSGGRPIRLAPGYLWQETYGIRTTAGDMARFLEINMGLIRVNRTLQRAILATHTAYFKAGVLTQDLIWEQYRFPVALKTLLEGNSPTMLFEAVPASELHPPQAPQANAWLNKTGSTNGFSAYVAFIPEKKLGIVILSNRSYSIDDRVTAGYDILSALLHGQIAVAKRQP